MQGFNVFQKGVHRIPTLALYKSLLKLSSDPILDGALSARVQKTVRSEFRKNKKCYSPRLVKGYLIQAFEIHALIEKVIRGDSNALSALVDRFQHKRSKPIAGKPAPPKTPLPERPPVIPPPEGFLSQAPSLHYPVFSLSWIIYPGSHNSLKGSHTVLRRLRQTRKLGDINGLLLSYIYYAKLEERFLRILARDMKQQWGLDTEAGVREMKAMSYDIGKFLADVELRENIKTELRLKEWASLNYGKRIMPQGWRMPRRRKRELRLWRQKVGAIKREEKQQALRRAFMRNWSTGLGSGSSISVFRHPHGGRNKRRAKKLRKRKLGNILL